MPDVYNPWEILPREELRKKKFQKLLKTVRLAFEKVKEFQNRVNKLEISTEKDFEQIPILPKKKLISLQENNFQDLLAVSIQDLAHIYSSPGPLFDPEGREKDYWGWTEAFYAMGFRPGDIVQNTFSYHLTPAGLMMEEPLRTLGCAIIPAGPGNTDLQIELMTKLKATGFVGMASYLKTIGERAQAKGLDLHKDFHLRVAFSAAEILTPSLRQTVEKNFNLTLRQGYGTADVGCIAYECECGQGMHLSTRCWVEICDPQSGEVLPPGMIGEVVVTPFSSTYPLIRLGTGDLAILDDSYCACGRTSPRIKAIVGRVDNTVKVKGQFVYEHQVQEVISNFPEIKNWQLVIENPQGKEKLTLYIQGQTNTKALFSQLKEKIKLSVFIEECPVIEDSKKILDKRIWEK